MKIVGKTDTGKVRLNNEDAFDFGKFNDGAAWAIVCDGMGGVHGGSVASSNAVGVIADKVRKCYNKTLSVSSLENLLLSSITTANVLISDIGILDSDLRGMGTTVVAAVAKDNEVCIAHVGDSRAYKISNGEIHLITKDHSLVQEMYDNGQITKEELENAPIKNIITRALGINDEVVIDFDFACVDEDEAIILCTDGLSGLVSDKQLLEIYNETDFKDLADKYIEVANDHGGRDNITVVIMKG